MGDLLRWIVVVTVRVGFWASIIFTFLPILVLLVSTILLALNGSVISDIYWMAQVWLPFNFNVVLLWLLTLVTAFALWWIAQKLYALLNQLVAKD